MPAQNFHIVVISKIVRDRHMRNFRCVCFVFFFFFSVWSYKCVINSECVWLFGDSLRVVTWCRSIIADCRCSNSSAAAATVEHKTSQIRFQNDTRHHLAMVISNGHILTTATTKWIALIFQPTADFPKRHFIICVRSIYSGKKKQAILETRISSPAVG